MFEHKERILLFDKNKTEFNNIQKVLREHGFQKIIEASSEDDVVAKASALNPEVVILDETEEGDVLRVIKVLKNFTAHIILMTKFDKEITAPEVLWDDDGLSTISGIMDKNQDFYSLVRLVEDVC